MLSKQTSRIILSLAIIFLSLLWPSQALSQEETKEQKIQRLTNDLQSNDEEKQKKAALELALIGKDAVLVLIHSLKTNRQPAVLSEVANSLCIIGEAAVPDLIDTLKREPPTANNILLLRHTSNALACIAEISKDDIPTLSEAVPSLEAIMEHGKATNLAAMNEFKTKRDLTDYEKHNIIDSLQDYDAAAHCLGRFGKEAKNAVPLLIERLRNQREDAYGILDSINLILADLIRNADVSANEEIIKSFATYESELQEKDRRSIQRRIDILTKIKESKDNDLSRIFIQYKFIIGIAILFLGWLFIFLLKPLWLLKIYEVFPTGESRLADVLGVVAVPIQYLLAPSVFHPRVLDAWVTKHLPKAQQTFSDKQTVKDRRVHVPVALFLDKKLVAEFTPQHLQATFARNQSRLLISGVGGAGKTSLACQIANWAMRDKEAARLCPTHAMLPVLLEHDFVEHGEDALKKAICAQLTNSIDAGTPIPNALLQALLEKKRVLLVVDGMSEMNEETRHSILSGISKIPINAVVFTSRTDEVLSELNKTVATPTKIKGNQLSSFVERYLTSLDQKELFDDEEFFEGCRLLSAIVGDRDVTALLAKLFVDQMVAMHKNIIDAELPHNIPEMMLQSIKVLHAKTPSDALPLRDVIKAAKVIAWACLQKDYRPLSADYEEVKRSLAQLPNGEKSLDHLKDKLNLIETTSFDQKIRFKIDPLTEYLAGMYLVEENKYQQEKWHKFFATASSKGGSAEDIKGFLLAVRDCCMTEDAQHDVPGFVVEKLTEITSIYQ